MNVESLLADLARRGIRLIPDPPKLIVEPASKLTDKDRQTLRAHKPALLALLARPKPWAVAPDSRHPLIEPEIRQKLETVEAEARAKGWPPELLWNNAFWDLPRGLAAVLDPEDEIAEVTADYISVLKCRRDIQRFRRTTG